MNKQPLDCDYVVIGSGFGGSVSALRLAEKGYRVIVVEKGKWLRAEDFPKSNWNLKKWLWLPFLRFFGLFKITLFRHVTVFSGVGVGGGSLVYANTLPVPKSDFFKSKSWAHLNDWESELKPFYPLALKMLGATQNPYLAEGDVALQTLSRKIGKEDHFQHTNVAVYFGKQGQTVKDPYFGGEGPDRTGCELCGGCMLGCRFNAKNTLDKNYLYFAQKHGAQIQAESEVTEVIALGNENNPNETDPNQADGTSGYLVKWQSSTALFNKKSGQIRCKGVVFAGGALGTNHLLLKLKETTLPRLSKRVGRGIRTNSESLLGVTSFDLKKDLSKGIAIGSILHTDDHSHLEPVRYSAGSGFWRLIVIPMVQGSNLLSRLGKIMWDFIRHPILNFKTITIPDFARYTQIMLFMQTLDSTLRFRRNSLGFLTSAMDQGTAPPTAFIPEAQTLAKQYAEIIDGKPISLISDSLLGIPSTAHILGGSTMGLNAEEGVIDKNNHVFGYQNMLVCDGSMITANIGVNPSLTITALSERAMSLIPPKESAQNF